MSSQVTPVQFPLTAIFDIQPPVEQNYEMLAAALASNPFSTTNNVLHFIRIVFLNNNTQVGVITTFDGDWQAYIQDFVNSSAEFFNNLLPFITPPDILKQIVPVQKNAVAFGDYVLSKNNPPSAPGQGLQMPAAWFSAYPTMTVVDIINCEQNSRNG